MAQKTLPGVRVGPLDPDATEHFGQVSGAVSARQLIRTHAAAHPQELVRALALPRDDHRTLALDLAEVRDELADDLPDGATLEGAAVRGDRDRPQVLTYSYRAESGRVVKWWTEYDADRFPSSVERGDEAVRIDELKKAGLPWSSNPETGEDLHIGTAEREKLVRENAGLRAQVEKLTKQIPAKGTGEDEAAKQAQAADEPVPGYDDLKAPQAVKLVKESDPETVGDILAFEKKNAKRKTVVSAAEQRLDAAAGGS